MKPSPRQRITQNNTVRFSEWGWKLAHTHNPSSVCRIDLVPPARSAGDLNSPCRMVWRRAIHFFLLLICFCGSQSPSWLLPLAHYWLVQHNDDRSATASSQLCTQSVELGTLIIPLVQQKMTAASLDQRAIYH